MTVDVTGAWEGTLSGAGAGGTISPAMRAVLDLEQEGPKVQGQLRTQGGRNSGFLEGRIGGDVFHFRVINSANERLAGEVTVSGDEMEGTFTLLTNTGSQTVRILLRRVSSPSRPQT